PKVREKELVTTSSPGFGMRGNPRKTRSSKASPTVRRSTGRIARRSHRATRGARAIRFVNPSMRLRCDGLLGDGQRCRAGRLSRAIVGAREERVRACYRRQVQRVGKGWGGGSREEPRHGASLDG